MIMHDWVMDWSIGTDHQISDPLLLRSQHPTSQSHGIMGRLLACLVLLLLSPTILFAWLKSLGKDQPWISRKEAAIPDAVDKGAGETVLRYHEFPNLSGYWRRYPQLWSIIKGQFRWVGNRPITLEQSASLQTEYEQLWLKTCYGLFSLADLHGAAGSFSEEEKVHSSYYAATQNRKNDIDLLMRCVFGTG